VGDPGSVFSILGQATLLTKRHAVTLILAVAAVSATVPLMLALAGHCFGSLVPACVSPEIYDWIGGEPRQAQYTAAEYALDFARYGISMIALLIFFATIVPRAEIGAVTYPPRRKLRLFGRIIVHRLVSKIVSVAFWLGSNLILIPAFGDDSSPGSRISHLSLIFCLTLFSSFLDSRIAFYLPAAAYSATPDRFWRCWAETRTVARPLFWIYLPMTTASVLINMYFWFWGPKSSVVQTAATVLARWTQSDAVVTAYVLSHSVGFVISALIGLLISGPISAAAFRVLQERESRVFE
jgi:hypothetical protein